MNAARVLAAAYLVTLMFSLGIELGWGRNREPRSVRLRPLINGLAVNLVLVPLLAVLLIRLWGTSGVVAGALLLLAVCPGGRYSPHLARIGGGAQPLSVELTLLLVKVTAISAPLAARGVLDVRRIDVSDLSLILQLLALQLMPLYAGKAIRRWHHSFANRIEKGVRIVSNDMAFILVASILFLTGFYRGLSLLRDRGWMPVLSLAALSAGAGWLLGGPRLNTRRTVAISANAHNLALALIIASSAYPGRRLQLAIIAIWAVHFLLDYALARIFGRRGSARPTGHAVPPIERESPA